MPSLKDELTKLFSDHFGDNTAQLLENYFDDKKELVNVVERMMTDLMGSKRASEHLNPIFKRYKIKTL